MTNEQEFPDHDTEPTTEKRQSTESGSSARDGHTERHSPQNRSENPSDGRSGHQSDVHNDGNRYRGEVYSKRVPAGKRTYFFDIKTTRSGEDFFLTITESKRLDESRYEKHKIFLYKEDFGKFVAAMHEAVSFVKDECLPDYEFRGLPDVSLAPQEGVPYSDGDA